MNWTLLLLLISVAIASTLAVDDYPDHQQTEEEERAKFAGKKQSPAPMETTLSKVRCGLPLSKLPKVHIDDPEVSEDNEDGVEGEAEFEAETELEGVDDRRNTAAAEENNEDYDNQDHDLGEPTDEADADLTTLQQKVFDDGSAYSFSKQDGVRIVGGENTKHEYFPWQVSMYYKGRHACGGSIINAKFILTAAHCLISKNMADYSIHIGKSKKIGKEPEEIVRKVKRVIPHKAWRKGKKHNNDIGLIELDKPIKFNKNAIPVCLPRPKSMSKFVKDKAPMTVTGYGETQGSGGEDNFKYANINFISESRCKALSEKYKNALSENMICAGNLNGEIDACQGDSGGPLVYKNPTTEAYTLYGLVSFGYGCAEPKKPGVYTKVENYIDWIKKNIAS